ncbi:hypothetical protein ACFOOM_14275 [Streptomyces echinoruber]|uniref:Uncharacterized protein n=1 Tax=Streptomyces echinoruber TaxID=68898 RepID=A0A918VL95_9ACTN|nr:hypothetical protein [Streptomyces echinoruber]GHA05688.1 hypothetical protein GCM10010389_51450 [Streptomyces echinoruber]
MSRTRLHTSLRPGETPVCDRSTGEIRVPIALYDLDTHQGDTSLVMSRREAEALFASLRAALVPVPEQRTMRPEAVR